MKLNLEYIKENTDFESNMDIARYLWQGSDPRTQSVNIFRLGKSEGRQSIKFDNLIKLRAVMNNFDLNSLIDL